MNAQPKEMAINSLMLGIRDVAGLMQCSERHITNLRKAGRMPPPVKLGAIVRWSRAVIEDWIRTGCPSMANLPAGEH